MTKHLRHIIKINLILLFFTSLNATIDIQMARKVAENIIVERSNNNSIKNFIVDTANGVDNFYIFNLEPSGFVIVSANENIIPILGYSFNKNLDLNNLPIQLNKVLNSYRENILYVLNNNIQHNESIKNLWFKYLGDFELENRIREVSPLITAMWNQGGEWNNLCPEDAYVGCVAVAMAQVMYYWGHPTTGSGYSSYYHEMYGPLSVNFSDFNYDFSNMEDEIATYDSQLLLYHSGIAVNMDYSPWGSGASVCWEGPSSQDALIENFNYVEESGCDTKINYTDDQWFDLLVNQLDNGWPIIYRAYGENDGPGHAWNIDGYQEGGYLHCNWGWGGSSNGYFYFNNLNGGGYNFVENQAALINILPQGFENPMALFEFEIDDLSVDFFDLSELINETEIIEWNWNFGDENNSSEPSPTHTYNNYGEYEVSLIVTNTYGLDSDVFYETIFILDLTGDINSDFSIDVIDVVMLIDLILNSIEINDTNNSADLNEDGLFSILDIVMLVEIILNN